MKRYEDFVAMSQDELFDYKELVGEELAQIEFLAARQDYENEKELDKLLKLYKQGD